MAFCPNIASAWIRALKREHVAESRDAMTFSCVATRSASATEMSTWRRASPRTRRESVARDVGGMGVTSGGAVVVPKEAGESVVTLNRAVVSADLFPAFREGVAVGCARGDGHAADAGVPERGPKVLFEPSIVVHDQVSDAGEHLTAFVVGDVPGDLPHEAVAGLVGDPEDLHLARRESDREQNEVGPELGSR